MKVPISSADRAPISRVRIVMNVPCSGAIGRDTSPGYHSAVSCASSRRIASGGVLCAHRYALMCMPICSLRCATRIT